jgi:hypothetical protein
MTRLPLTQHASLRIAQRGISIGDLELITLIGSEVDDGYLVRTKDCQAIEQNLAKLLSRVQRLKGKRVVVANGRVITAFHATRPEQRHLLRYAEKRCLTRYAR